MNSLTPLVSPHLHDLLQQQDLLFNAKNLHAGPVHVIVPTSMDDNISRLEEMFKNLDIEGLVYYAHKPNKSPAFVKQALKNGIGIDVASRQELISALAAGYRGEQISCTGAKNNEFLYLAIQHGTLISVDSLEELDTVIQLKNTLKKDGVRVLLRIADPVIADRNLRLRLSRFGIARQDISTAYKHLQEAQIELVGFHFHNDERSADVKAGFVAYILECIEQAYAMGFSPSIIDIGGGLRTHQLEHFEEWEQFLSTIEYKLLERESTGTWRNYGFGMYVNERGKISGREKIQGKFTNNDFEEIYTDLFNATTSNGRQLADIIRESMLSVMVEPGFALLQQCGISLVSVVGTKKASNGDALIVLDANIYNLSTQMNELMLDPILLTKTPDGKTFSGYPIGNLCREEDVLMKRAVTLPHTPRAGDILCFVNTAAYTSDFEDGAPHQHISGKKVVAIKNKVDWKLCSEEVYNPFLQS